VAKIISLTFEYFYGSEAEQFSFYRIPKILMTAPHFKKLSSDAKITYGLMLDRMGLSMKNGWIDNENKVYIFFTLDDVQANINCSHTTGVKILAELDVKNGIGLIEREKQGQGKPTRIYVKNFNSLQNKNVHRFGSADFQNVDTNKNNYSQINLNDTEYQSIHQAETARPTAAPQSDMIIKMEIYREILHDNIDYENLVCGYGVEKVNEYVQLMLDVICSKKGTVRIDCADYPIEIVKSRFLKLDQSHIEYVIDRMAKSTTKVHNIRSYLLTALYNSYTSIDSFYGAEVNHDFYG